MLSVPPRDTLGVPEEVAVAAAVPANPWNARDVGAVDLQGGRGRLQAGEARTAHHARFGALDVPEFRSVVLGQLGEARLLAAIDTDIAGERSHARTLDADTSGVLRDIHRRVGTTILFESSGGQVHKVAHLPELRFALGEPEVDTTSVDTAAVALEAKAFHIQRVGSDGFKVFHKAKIDKAVHDRRASLDEDEEVKPTIRTMVKDEIKRGASIPVEPFPTDSSTVPDSPRLTLVVLNPTHEWDGREAIRTQITEWTKRRGKSDRLYPGALVWCVRKAGRDLRDKVELLLAWRRVQRDVLDGVLGADFERADHQEIQTKVRLAEDDAKDEVWAGYRFVVLADSADPSGLKVIDLGWPLQWFRNAVRTNHLGTEGRGTAQRVCWGGLH